MWGRQLAEAMLAEAGFSEVTVREIEQDTSNYFYIARR
ncbi:methylase involved in ubiquinone/menaquinone biosynthesis [Mycobacteroides abscessus]|nr:methylase involved in ubiquinone/menaquinone biosynthesis [Mycobacteroides abscessus]